MKEINTEILIVGAGYAGIAAAKKMYAANQDFRVIEARDRIGGRTLTEDLQSGVTVDMGAKWVGPTQHLVWEWIKETQTETYDTYDQGKNLLKFKEKISSYTGTIPKIDPVSLIDLGIAISKMNKLSDQISISEPWNHPKAKEYDAMTLATWMDKHIWTAKAKHLFEIGIQTVFAAEASEISLLFALFYFKSGDNMDTLISIKNGAQQSILKGGTQGLIKKIAAPFLDKIHFQEPVFRLSQHAGGIIAETDNLTIKAKKCIFTIPPVLISSVVFDPPLTQQKAQLYQRMPMGAAMKVYLIYPTPFWREMGFSGQIVSDEYPLKVTFDVGHADADQGVLLVFVEGNDARNFIDLPEDTRKKMIVERVEKIFGHQASQPIQYIDKCWTEEVYSRGCYTGLMGPNTLTQFGHQIRAPFQHVHFAGTETAEKWSGYLDGAISSGYRAASEVLKML
ncbi:flavin monoamine oxidase family protein [Aquirufa aurantiipilula]|uniref:flavin monoamine oxidase family protein n=1 Tax=Aquirufa aurantiipilula TaxID=2696561 RepID=UPI001CAA5AD3|nr:FAD-dependent oxidoreductase [Aquirufa aurantiipilula]MBZ1326126.1 NAD(P)-binding protein [Aquirufa aurantiipilula]